MRPSLWLLRQPGPRRRARLFCFSYAGGNPAAFLPWQKAIDPAIEICAIQLPGRGTHLAEPATASMPTLIKALAHEISRLSDLPFAFFGHSLGGLLAFEVTRWCKLDYLPLPVHLFVSACAAPQSRNPTEALHQLPDTELIQRLASYNGTPPEVLAHRELMEILLPAIRADFQLVEEYRYRPGLPLGAPITVLAGRRDRHVTAEQAAGWRRETLAACQIRWFEGDHFFIHGELEAVLDCISTGLSETQSQNSPNSLHTYGLARE
jgi:surfactin synthase thioesterase subunit